VWLSNSLISLSSSISSVLTDCLNRALNQMHFNCGFVQTYSTMKFNLPCLACWSLRCFPFISFTIRTYDNDLHGFPCSSVRASASRKLDSIVITYAARFGKARLGALRGRGEPLSVEPSSSSSSPSDVDRRARLSRLAHCRRKKLIWMDSLSPVPILARLGVRRPRAAIRGCGCDTIRPSK